MKTRSKKPLPAGLRVLYVLCICAWVVTGIFAALGAMTWFQATFLSFVCSAPFLIYRMWASREDDE